MAKLTIAEIKRIMRMGLDSFTTTTPSSSRQDQAKDNYVKAMVKCSDLPGKERPRNFIEEICPLLRQMFKAHPRAGEARSLPRGLVPGSDSDDSQFENLESYIADLKDIDGILACLDATLASGRIVKEEN